MATVGVVSDGFSGVQGDAKRIGGVSCQGIGDPKMAGMGVPIGLVAGRGVGAAFGLPAGFWRGVLVGPVDARGLVDAVVFAGFEAAAEVGFFGGTAFDVHPVSPIRNAEINMIVRLRG
jgi:hypothetical protein